MIPTVLALIALALTNPVSAARCTLHPEAQALMRPGNVVIIGELHGTAELPAFVGALVECAVAKVVGVYVGLELPTIERDMVDVYLASQGTEVDRKRLLSAAHWIRPAPRQDGRSSAAMIELLETLRRLKADGRSIKVFPFDSPVPPEAERDQVMAATVVKELRDLGGKMGVILTGSLHARTADGEHGVPMAKHLFRQHRALTALNHEVREGEAWQCRPEGCQAWPLTGMDQGAELTVQVYPTPDANGYHGMVYTPVVTASAPAK